jgi:hypothetical protein
MPASGTAISAPTTPHSQRHTMVEENTVSGLIAQAPAEDAWGHELTVSEFCGGEHSLSGASAYRLGDRPICTLYVGVGVTRS